MRKFEWKTKLILSPVITFSDSGNAVETTVTVATMMIKEPWQSVKSENNKVSSGSDELEDEEPPVPTFSDALSSLKLSCLTFTRTG